MTIFRLLFDIIELGSRTKFEYKSRELPKEKRRRREKKKKKRMNDDDDEETTTSISHFESIPGQPHITFCVSPLESNPNLNTMRHVEEVFIFRT